MQSADLKHILQRVAKWPRAAQEDLAQAAREIEDDLIDDPHLINELQDAHHEALREAGGSLEEIKERLAL